jgi:hypothetical protein
MIKFPKRIDPTNVVNGRQLDVSRRRAAIRHSPRLGPAHHATPSRRSAGSADGAGGAVGAARLGEVGGRASSSNAYVLGRRWWYWQGQHIQYFTQASLERLARQAGLDVVRTDRYPFAATHETISNSLRRYRAHRLMSALLRPLFAVRPVVYLRLPGEMLFFARKPR